MIHPSRVRRRNDRPERDGRHVLYWMQASQRTRCNHALEYAVRAADRLGLPLLVTFCPDPLFPGANLRHFTFMAEGLEDVGLALSRRGIGWRCRMEGYPAGVAKDAKDAALLVMDKSYLSLPRHGRADVAGSVRCACVEVESNVVVPVDTASEKEEWSAAPLRRKINRLLPLYMQPLEESDPNVPWEGDEEEYSAEEMLSWLIKEGIDTSPLPSPVYSGGEEEAWRRLEVFLAENLRRYPEERSSPAGDVTSHLSPYLHFGQISPLSIALAAVAADPDAAEPFLEELIVRRELAVNFCRRNPYYTSPLSLPSWAKETLDIHSKDPRPYLYSPEEMGAGETHDPCWNAAQDEMRIAGSMHNYMRMYWGKKILEWSATPEEGYKTALSLNNRYELDGRDPNGYAGVAWCFGKHDRAWKEREIFGKVRIMTEAGLHRKFDMDAYISRIECLRSGDIRGYLS